MLYLGFKIIFLVNIKMSFKKELISRSEKWEEPKMGKFPFNQPK